MKLAAVGIVVVLALHSCLTKLMLTLLFGVGPIEHRHVFTLASVSLSAHSQLHCSFARSRQARYEGEPLLALRNECAIS